MKNAKIHYSNLDDDMEYERTAWFTALLMSASGNYGKKGIEPKKLYSRQFDNEGNPLEETKNKLTPISAEEKEKRMRELLAKFNKDYDEVTKGE